MDPGRVHTEKEHNATAAAETPPSPAAPASPAPPSDAVRGPSMVDLADLDRAVREEVGGLQARLDAIEARALTPVVAATPATPAAPTRASSSILGPVLGGLAVVGVLVLAVVAAVKRRNEARR